MTETGSKENKTDKAKKNEEKNEPIHRPTAIVLTYPVLSAFGGGRRLFNATREENMEALVEDAVALAISTFVTAGIAMLLTTLGVGLINWSALRQITTIRQLFLKAVLRQDMSWFDTDTEFNLASKMSENLAKLKEGNGRKTRSRFKLAGNSSAVALSNYQTKSATREMESYSQAGKHAEEILKSVRTVAAFGGEAKEVER
ncbi:unnamed protein product [Arctia plantaginis]|uniref:ABC transmembrane type-1 domain-containing protein n=1 Tax=Arctia plantaginis TaxID=874455 RepID=A0A8S0ZM38_ARCPL|nr:unnamed protein product [Arctia plantaginis]